MNATLDLTPYVQPAGNLNVNITRWISPELQVNIDAQMALLPEPCGQRVLEIGPAGGHTTVMLQNRYGIDRVDTLTRFEDEAEVARASGVASVTLADMHKMPPEWTERFDIIRACHVLEHSPAPIVFLAECVRLLVWNGVLQLVWPDPDGTTGGHRIGSVPPHCFPARPDTVTDIIHQLRHLHLGLGHPTVVHAVNIPMIYQGRLEYVNYVLMVQRRTGNDVEGGGT